VVSEKSAVNGCKQQFMVNWMQNAFTPSYKCRPPPAVVQHPKAMSEPSPTSFKAAASHKEQGERRSALLFLLCVIVTAIILWLAAW
jgi:hypothetical protein